MKNFLLKIQEFFGVVGMFFKERAKYFVENLAPMKLFTGFIDRYTLATGSDKISRKTEIDICTLTRKFILAIMGCFLWWLSIFAVGFVFVLYSFGWMFPLETLGEFTKSIWLMLNGAIVIGTAIYSVIRYAQWKSEQNWKNRWEEKKPSVFSIIGKMAMAKAHQYCFNVKLK
jgi:hypothetical protein